MVYTGNVVKFNDKDELYVVAETSSLNNKLNKIRLIPFKYDNMTIHISKDRPVMTEIYEFDACKNKECDCIGPCPTKLVPSKTNNIDTIKFIASNIESFIMSKFKKLIYD